MNSASRRSSADRDRAVGRLRTITIGTGLAGVVAVGGFGAIAAASYDGTSKNDGAITAAVTTAADTTSTSTSTSTTAADTSPTSTTSTTTSSSGLSTTTAPTTTTGGAHASTGSS